MTEYFAATDLPQHMDQGLLASIFKDYAALLSQQCFTRQYGRLQLRLLSDLNQWLLEHRLQISDLSKQTLHQYLRSRHRRFRPRRDDQSILRRLLQLLYTQGFLLEEAPESQSLINPHQSLEEDFGRYLVEERGLSMSTLINYRPFVHRFLSAQFGIKPVCFADLNAGDVIRFIQNQAPGLSPKRAGLMVSALRSFFRYLRHRGDIAIDLAACVPPIANWQFSSLPKFLQYQQVQQVLSQCDRRTARGRRDYAILLLLARLGLRACEVVSMTLDDIHWQAGEITIKGKGKRIALLPLPLDVGRAIADYLKKDRPVCSTRHVFIRMKAPRREFAGSQAISTIVARSLERARIDSPYKGAHLFRHTLATQMLSQGSSLGDIGLLLRHRSLNTTTLYAKVDLTALRVLAQPWPGGVL